MAPQKVLITGVSGLVGSAAYLHLAQWPECYALYGLGRRRALSERVFDQRAIDMPEDRFFVCDIADMDGVRGAVAGMDAVVHMAADPAGRGWESLRDNNLIGAYNVFEACKEAGVKRLVAASTIQVSVGDCEQEPYKAVIEGRDGDLPAGFAPVTVQTPGQPRNLYAASKVWAESLARVYGHTTDLSCLCIRIGWVTGEDEARGGRGDIWCSQRDIAQMVECCIAAPLSLRYEIFFAVSDNKWSYRDVEHARKQVGYEPLDAAEAHR